MCWAKPGSKFRDPWAVAGHRLRGHPSSIPMYTWAGPQGTHGKQREFVPGGEAGVSTAAGAGCPGGLKTMSEGPKQKVLGWEVNARSTGKCFAAKDGRSLKNT